ncbi:MAG: hypothetical protein HYY85_08705 [Deltaproteobacteria bacterium]|nr:hypothetical protein [Deltaproteobacteria bacterium]
MRISNDPGGGPSGPFAELFRLQTEFLSRLGEETLRYLRRLQGALGPGVPGTVVAPAGPAELRASGPRGGRAELRLEVENRQRVHSMATPMLTPLVDPSGVTWFPAVEPSPISKLLAPEEVGVLVLSVTLPKHLPAGTYRGALLLQGFREGGVPVRVTVTNGRPGAPASRRARPARAKGGRRRGRTR